VDAKVFVACSGCLLGDARESSSVCVSVYLLNYIIGKNLYPKVMKN